MQSGLRCPRPVEVYVFGSVVEGRHTVDSDLDIAIVMPEALRKARKVVLVDNLNGNLILAVCRQGYGRSPASGERSLVALSYPPTSYNMIPLWNRLLIALSDLLRPCP